MDIQVRHLAQTPRTGFGKTTNIETAILVTEGGVIHPTLADMMPRKTVITPLTSTEDSRLGTSHTYRVQTHEYTVREFNDVAKAFADDQVETALELIEAIRPQVASGRPL